MDGGKAKEAEAKKASSSAASAPKVSAKKKKTNKSKKRKRRSLSMEEKDTVDTFLNDIEKKALKIVTESFPTKILVLNNITEQLDASPYLTPYKPCKKGETVPVNTNIQELLELLKTEIIELVDMMGSLTLWIRLKMPKIQDGNNFGVGVQEEMLVMLMSGKASGQNVLRSIQTYFYRRGERIAEAIKNPTVDDCVQNIIEMDMKQYVNLRMGAKDLRNNYMLLWDKLEKNRDKIVAPTGSREDDNPMMMY